MKLGTYRPEARRQEEILCSTNPDVYAFSEIGPVHRPLRTVWHDRAIPRSDSPASAPTIRALSQANVSAARVAPLLSGGRTRGCRARLVQPTRHRLRSLLRGG